MGRTNRKRKRKRNKCRELAFDNGNLNELLKWMRCKKTNLRIRHFDETGRGISSTKKIRVGDDLISLPFRLLITPKNFGSSLELLDNKLSPQLTLSVILMYERHLGDESKYRPYLDVLPCSYSTLFFCSKKEIEVLPNFMKNPVLTQIEQIKNYYEKLKFLYSSKSCLHCGIHLNEIFNFSVFTWSWFTVNTRCIYYKEGVEDSLALAPLLDMFNHSWDAGNEIIIDQEKEIYTVKSLREFKKRQQVFIKYGSHSNWKLIFEYGFLLKNNPNDVVEFTFEETIKSCKIYNNEYGKVKQTKMDYIKRKKLDKNLTKSKDEFSWNVKALLYILITKDECWTLINAKCFSNEFDNSEENDIKEIMKIMKEIKMEQLKKELKKMNSISNCSHSFSLAKELLEIHISFLDKS